MVDFLVYSDREEKTIMFLWLQAISLFARAEATTATSKGKKTNENQGDLGILLFILWIKKKDRKSELSYQSNRDRW